MSRISSHSFKVNANQEQIVDVGTFTANVTVEQPIHNQLNCNANMQQGDTDVGSGNKLYVQSNLAGDFLVDANMQQGDSDVSASNKLHTQSTAADDFLVNANVQQGDADVSGSNKLHVQSSSADDFAVNANLQVGDADVSTTNRVPVNATHDVQGSQGNLDSASSVSNGSTSTAIDVSESKNQAIYGNTTDLINRIDIEVSANNSNYYPITFSIYPDSSTGDFYQKLDNNAVKYIRLKYNGTATVTATLTHA